MEISSAGLHIEVTPNGEKYAFALTSLGRAIQVTEVQFREWYNIVEEYRKNIPQYVGWESVAKRFLAFSPFLLILGLIAAFEVVTSSTLKIAWEAQWEGLLTLVSGIALLSLSVSLLPLTAWVSNLQRKKQGEINDRFLASIDQRKVKFLKNLGGQPGENLILYVRTGANAPYVNAKYPTRAI